MSAVVSDTSPLHYLILCGSENILPKLFGRVLIPPTVLRELRQPNTPPLVRQWAAAMPSWVILQTPKMVNSTLNLDEGEMEAICLAQEIQADVILMDDLAGRKAAIRRGLAVVGTIGLMELASTRGLLDLSSALECLRMTNARLDPELIRAALARNKASQ